MSKLVYHPYPPCPSSYQTCLRYLSTLSTAVSSLSSIFVNLVYRRIKLAYHPYYLPCPPSYQAFQPSISTFSRLHQGCLPPLSTLSTVASRLSTTIIYLVHRRIKLFNDRYLLYPRSYQACLPSLLATLSVVVLSLPTIPINYIVHRCIKLVYHPYFLPCPSSY